MAAEHVERRRIKFHRRKRVPLKEARAANMVLWNKSIAGPAVTVCQIGNNGGTLGKSEVAILEYRYFLTGVHFGEGFRLCLAGPGLDTLSAIVETEFDQCPVHTHRAQRHNAPDNAFTFCRSCHVRHHFSTEVRMSISWVQADAGWLCSIQ